MAVAVAYLLLVPFLCYPPFLWPCLCLQDILCVGRNFRGVCSSRKGTKGGAPVLQVSPPAPSSPPPPSRGVPLLMDHNMIVSRLFLAFCCGGALRRVPPTQPQSILDYFEEHRRVVYLVRAATRFRVSLCVRRKEWSLLPRACAPARHGGRCLAALLPATLGPVTLVRVVHPATPRPPPSLVMTATCITLSRCLALVALPAGWQDEYWTSQKCHHCKEFLVDGARHRDKMCKTCGVEIDRDHNAALNLKAVWEWWLSVRERPPYLTPPPEPTAPGVGGPAPSRRKGSRGTKAGASARPGGPAAGASTAPGLPPTPPATQAGPSPSVADAPALAAPRPGAVLPVGPCGPPAKRPRTTKK